MDKIKNHLPFLLLLIVAAAVIVEVFPLIHPYGGIRLPLDAQAIEQKSRDLLSSMNISVDGLTP
jgi:hypothetical protein